VLSWEPVPASRFRSLVGFLGHFQCVLAADGYSLYAFHDALAAAGTAPATIVARTDTLMGAAHR
jgi:hypothetical protein